MEETKSGKLSRDAAKQGGNTELISKYGFSRAKTAYSNMGKKPPKFTSPLSDTNSILYIRKDDY